MLPSVIDFANVSDSCNTTFTLSQSPLNSTITSPGNYSVTIIAKDESGNTGNVSNRILFK